MGVTTTQYENTKKTGLLRVIVSGDIFCDFQDRAFNFFAFHRWKNSKESKKNIEVEVNKFYQFQAASEKGKKEKFRFVQSLHSFVLHILRRLSVKR